MSKNKKITRKAFILKASKIACGYINLESNNIDVTGFLIYRKSDQEFTVLSRECTHAGCPVDPFTSPSIGRNETGC